MTSWVAVDGQQMLVPGGLGNELVVHKEYAEHPTHGEGPWHLSPTGVLHRSSHHAATVRCEVSPIGERLVIEGLLPTSAARLGESDSRFTSTLTLLRDVDRVDVEIAIDEPALSDELVRYEWAAAAPGATPVVEVGDAVIGRGFAFTEVDTAKHSSTLDTAATNWFASSATACLAIGDPADASSCLNFPFAVAELVVADWAAPAMATARRIVVALAGSGVTTTTTVASSNRAGKLGFDTNAPDIRIAAGVLGQHGLIGAALDRLDKVEQERVKQQLATQGWARIWVPGSAPPQWLPGLDVTAVDAIGMLVVVAIDAASLELAVDVLVGELQHHRIDLREAGVVDFSDRVSWTGRSVAMINTGTPSCAVTAQGVLSSAIMRSCTGWPSGQWIEPPRRTMPDGTSFQLQHWTHNYEFSMLARPGDWRCAGISSAAHARQHPLEAKVHAVDETALAADEAARPVFSRWWRQGQGAMQRVDAPLNVRIRPVDRLGPGAACLVDLVRLPEALVAIRSSEDATTDIEVEIEVTSGSCLVAVETAVLGPDTTHTISVPASDDDVRVVVRGVWRDGRTWAIYDQIDRGRTPLVSLATQVLPVSVPIGGQQSVELVVENSGSMEAWVDLDVLCPWGTWDIVEPRHQLTVAPQSRAAISLDFAARADATPGAWWWMVRLIAGPTVAYSEVASLEVVRS